MNYSWPGNVRELQNAVERALILCKGKPLIFEDIGEPAKKIVSPMIQMNNGVASGLDQAISQHIKRALEMTGGQVGGEKGAAKWLNMNPSTLRTKMRKLGIPFGKKGLR
jgi:DNA-binding NtrC family response regulator